MKYQHDEIEPAGSFALELIKKTLRESNMSYLEGDTVGAEHSALLAHSMLDYRPELRQRISAYAVELDLMVSTK